MSLETSHVLFFKHISLQWLSIINNILTISLLNVIWFFHVQYRSCIVHLYCEAFKLLTIKTFENMCLSSWIEHICYTIDNEDFKHFVKGKNTRLWLKILVPSLSMYYISSIFSSNSEAFASELLENIEEMFLL